MRKITNGRLRLVLQPHAVYLSGFKNPRAPLSGAATSAGASYNTELPHPVTRAPLRNSDQQTSETLPCISTPEAVATNNVMPPLLIPFTSVGHTIPHISQQSPLVPSVPDARDLYTSSESVHESQITSYANRWISCQYSTVCY